MDFKNSDQRPTSTFKGPVMTIMDHYGERGCYKMGGEDKSSFTPKIRGTKGLSHSESGCTKCFEVVFM